MASAWGSVNWSCAAIAIEAFVLNRMPSVFPRTRQSFACWRLFDPRRISITRSITLTALMRPSWISRFFFSSARRFSYLRLVTSKEKSTLARRTALRLMVSGRPLWIASMLTPKVSSSFVFL